MQSSDKHTDRCLLNTLGVYTGAGRARLHHHHQTSPDSWNTVAKHSKLRGRRTKSGICVWGGGGGRQAHLTDQEAGRMTLLLFPKFFRTLARDGRGKSTMFVLVLLFLKPEELRLPPKQNTHLRSQWGPDHRLSLSLFPTPVFPSPIPA